MREIVCDLSCEYGSFLVQQVKEGFGSVLLTHLDCLPVFSLIPRLQLKHCKLISSAFIQFRPSALQLSQNFNGHWPITSEDFV